MICYRDRWFCGESQSSKCKKAETCDRVMTESEFEKAKRWSETFTKDGTILVCYQLDNDCFEEK